MRRNMPRANGSAESKFKYLEQESGSCVQECSFVDQAAKQANEKPNGTWLEATNDFITTRASSLKRSNCGGRSRRDGDEDHDMIDMEMLLQNSIMIEEVGNAIKEKTIKGTHKTVAARVKVALGEDVRKSL
ncbi:hypothetical protein GBA52_010185 [Prunus armeniaca]|nr:hypothetical protein GBA52_010185 [Prunus armeniaca]